MRWSEHVLSVNDTLTCNESECILLVKLKRKKKKKTPTWGRRHVIGCYGGGDGHTIVEMGGGGGGEKNSLEICRLVRKNMQIKTNLSVTILNRAGPGQDPVRPFGPGPARAGPGPPKGGPVHKSLTRTPGPSGPVRVGPRATVLWPCPWTV